jgi:hypothetical protein
MRRGLTSDWVSQVKGTASLEDDRVVEEEVECLLGDPRARDVDVLVAGDLSGLGDRGFNAIDERRSRPPLGGVLGCAMSDHDDGSARRVVVTPTVGDVEQASAGDECAGVSGQLS